MIFNISGKKIFLLSLFLAVFSFFLIGNVEAAPEVWMTWRASSYVPPDFPGKALPSEGTLTTVSFEVVDGGRFVSLAEYEIYWYLNDELIQTGMGAQQVSFRAPNRGNHKVRAQVNGYNDGNLVKTIEIPAVRPEAVIVAPYPNDVFSSSEVQVRATPFFFNTTDPEKLNYSWNVNGRKPVSEENISFLNISLGGATTNGYELQIRLSITSPVNPLLQGSTSKTLNFEK